MKLIKVTMLVKLLLTSKRLLTQLGGGGGVCIMYFQYGISRFWKNMVGKRYFQHQTVPVIAGNNNKKSGFETIINGIEILMEILVFCVQQKRNLMNLFPIISSYISKISPYILNITENKDGLMVFIKSHIPSRRLKVARLRKFLPN